jgi:putative membrane protein
MEPQSAFQQKYPLSPKKFLKKILGDLIGYVFYALILSAILTFGVVMLVALMNPDNPNTTSVPVVISIFLGIAVIFYAIFVGFRAWYLKVYIRRYYYNGEDFFITIKKGVFAPREIHVQYQKIQDVYVDQDILDRMLGLYDVHIASATSTSGIEAHIDGVEKDVADGLKVFLLDAVRNGAQKQQQPAQSAQPGAQPADAVKFSLNEEVTSVKYPLTGKWLFSSLLSRVLGAFWVAFIFTIIFALPGKHSDTSILDAAGGWINGYELFAIFLVLSMIWSIVSLLLWKHNYSFRFDPDTIYFKTGVIAIAEKHMPYASIQNVNLNQSVFDRILGIADVVIENAATHQVIVNKTVQQVSDKVMIEGVSRADAQHLTDLLKQVTLSRNSSAMGL